MLRRPKRSKIEVLTPKKEDEEEALVLVPYVSAKLMQQTSVVFCEQITEFIFLFISVLSDPSCLRLRARRPRKEIQFPAGAEYFPHHQTSEPPLGTIQPSTPWVAMAKRW